MFRLILVLFFLHSIPYTFFAQTSPFEAYQSVQQASKLACQKQDYKTAILTTENFIKKHTRYSLAYLEQSSYAIQARDVHLLKRNIIALKSQQVSIPLDLLLTGAQLAARKHLPQLGLEILAEATPSQAKSEVILLQKAQFYQKLNQPNKALTVLQEAQGKHPTSNKILQELAAAYQSINKQRSIQLYELLLKKQGYENLSLAALGLLYTQLYEAEPSANNRNNLLKARQYYQQYLHRHPNDKNIKDLLSNLDTLLP